MLGEVAVSDPDDVAWYISRDGQRIGPLTAEEFAQLEESGRLRPTDQVWQTGMREWIAYRDYNMREAATRFASPTGPSSSPRTSPLYAITNTLRGALRGISKRVSERLARPTPARGTDPEAPVTSEPKPSSQPRPFADLQEMIAASPSGAHEPSLRLLAEPLVPRTADHTPQHSQPDRNRTVPTIEHVAEPPRPSSPIRQPIGEVQDVGSRRFAAKLVQPVGVETPVPSKQDQAHKVPTDPVPDTTVHAPEQVHPSLPAPRLANEVQAAALIGLDLTTFRKWVADGRFPRALPDCGKYDLKAIHLALDRMSNIASSPGPTNGRPHPLARNRD